ncbi:MAG: methionyl-tRNA formyltransferase [Candidatus Colwellbacteria bacterium]
MNQLTSEAKSLISVGVRYIFFGTPNFAAIILEKLIRAGMLPVALVCNPDRPVGRKQDITPPPTKLLALQHSIPVLQPESLENYEQQITNYKPEFSIVAAYARILPKEILEIPRLGTIGVHPSLLPKYRGPSPIQSAILAGEKETGVTLFLMDEKLDHGPIIAGRKITIEGSSANSHELADELAEISAKLLIEVLPKFLEGGDQSPACRQAGLLQDESQATYTKKFTSEDAFVSEEDLAGATSGNSPEKAIKIARKIRALNPEPGVWTLRGDKRVKLLEAKLIDSRLQLTRIQKEGKTPSVLS